MGELDLHSCLYSLLTAFQLFARETWTPEKTWCVEVWSEHSAQAMLYGERYTGRKQEETALGACASEVWTIQDYLSQTQLDWKRLI